MAEARWREPTSLLPLRWGSYADRYFTGLVLVIGGAVQLLGSNTYTLPLLLLGTVAHAVGWVILPAAGWRRMLVLVPATVQTWLMLTGPQLMWTIVIPYLAWLLVRHRPPLSYVTAIVPLATGLILAQLMHEYSSMPLALSISLAALVAAAWLARALAALSTPAAN